MKGRARLDLILAVAILLVLVVANATVYAPKRRKLDALADELVRAESELLYVAGHSEALARVADYLPEHSEDSGDHRFLSGVTAELDRLDLALSRVEPQGETPYSGAYVKRGYKMQIEGDYEGMSSFLEYLESMSDVVVVDAFDYRSSVTRSDSKHRASLSVSVIGY